jgi:hypothetical protein
MNRAREFFTLLDRLFSGRRSVIAAVAVAFVGWCLAVTAAKNWSTTSDELVHLTGGTAFWHGDYRFHPENGNLPQRWAALPAVLTQVPFPIEDNEVWRKSDAWMQGYRFFYRNGTNHQSWLWAGRAMNAVWGMATAVLVFLWSRKLWGQGGGWLSLLLCVLCPNILANSGLATSDMAMTFFFLASTAGFWSLLCAPSPARLIVSAIIFGLACVAKYSSVLLLPICVVLIGARALHKAPWTWRGRALSRAQQGVFIAGAIATHVLISAAIIWAFFGFRYSPVGDSPPFIQFIRPWGWVLAHAGFQANIINALRAWHILPEAFLYGYTYVVDTAQVRAAFLGGDYSIYGWWYFFPYAFLVKTPLPTLLLCSLGLIAAIRAAFVSAAKPGGARPLAASIVPLLALAGIYWAFSLTSNLNIGLRHLLPAYPPLFILAGAVGPWAARRGRIAVAGCVAAAALVAIDSFAIRPHYLSYFNALVGGPKNGWRHLADSSLDWGQDLPALVRWLKENRRPGEPLHLSYFGTSEPAYYGIDAIEMPMIHDFHQQHPWYWLQPGLYAISATMLQHVYMPIRGEWTLALEKEYQSYHGNDAVFRTLKESPHGHPEVFSQMRPEIWAMAWNRYEQLRFARLCHYLRARGPDAFAGYSILIFRLEESELQKAVDGSLQEWSRAIVDAAQHRR